MAPRVMHRSRRLDGCGLMALFFPGNSPSARSDALPGLIMSRLCVSQGDSPGFASHPEFKFNYIVGVFRFYFFPSLYK